MAQAEGDPDSRLALQAQIDELLGFYSKAVGLGGKSRDLNNPFDKLRPKVWGRINRVIKAFRSAQPPLIELADHLEAAISNESGAFVYRSPVKISWQFHLRGKM